MEISITITVPFFGLTLQAEIDGTYTHDTFEPESVWVRHIGSADVYVYLPTPADVSDFYSAHGVAIDGAVRAELADYAESVHDLYEIQRQAEIDDAAERGQP